MDPSIGLNLQSQSEISGQMDFSFDIEPDGSLFGEGEGKYIEANYLADGSWEKGAISCVVPVTGSTFRVTVQGKVAVSPGARLGEIAYGDVELKLDGAEETSPEVPCGAEFSIFESTTTILANSLAALLEPPGLESPLVLKDEGVSDTLPKDVPYDNGAGETGSDDGTWTFVITPSSTLKVAAEGLEARAVLSAGSALAMQMVVQECMAFIPPPFEINCTLLMRFLSAASAAESESDDEAADDPIDRHYTAVAKPFVASAPRVPPIPGLDAKAAATLQRLLKAQARVVGLSSALATAVDRYGGAALARNARWEQRQRAAARLYAEQLASALAVQLTDAKAAERVLARTVLNSRQVTAAELRAFRRGVRANGVPSSLAQELRRFKLSPSALAGVPVDLERADAAVLATPTSLAGVLDPPAQENATRAAIEGLRAFAKTGK
jgi:hypothetical protein